MMRVFMIAIVFLLIDLGVSPLAVRGQTLGDVAAKEKERRSGKTTRVITDEDLAKARRTAPPVEAPGAGATAAATPAEGAAASPAAGKSEDEIRAEQAKAWRERRDQAEKEVATLSDRIQELQRITGDRRIYQYDPTRARLIQELKQTQDNLALAQQRLEDLIEEGRRAGF
jgi:hypothetical protein